VVVKAAIASSEESKGLATITVELNVKDGWHTYAQLPDDSPSMATAAKLTLPEGVEAIGEWNVPAGEDYAKEPGTTVFEGKIKLTRDVKITASSKRRTIGVQVN
jgi:DsbC/DsbD-like thiol-disulfide interchange protein